MFQTLFGVKRLVTLPMGWTNVVPIFHDDVAHVLKEETPHVTNPYIDNVGLKGPKTRYEQPDGTYETVSENLGIRCFVWKHLQNVNRMHAPENEVLQWNVLWTKVCSMCIRNCRCWAQMYV